MKNWNGIFLLVLLAGLLAFPAAVSAMGVTLNNGDSVTTNIGAIETMNDNSSVGVNRGTIDVMNDNSTVQTNDQSGTIGTMNDGSTVDFNVNLIETVNAGSTVGTNLGSGTIRENHGEVLVNFGIVTDNQGTVRNRPGGVVSGGSGVVYESVVYKKDIHDRPDSVEITLRGGTVHLNFTPYTKVGYEQVGWKLLNGSYGVVSAHEDFGSSYTVNDSVYAIPLWRKIADALGISIDEAREIADYLSYDEFGAYYRNEAGVKIYVWFHNLDICMRFMGSAEACGRYNG